MSLFHVDKKTAMGDDTKYSRAIRTPQYVPSEEKPPISSLMDYSKYAKLLYNINHSNVSDEEKQFLRLAAGRHVVFNYAKVADYYAHADKEMQELMEQSALIILDIDDAIANGYVTLSAKMKQLVDEAKSIRELMEAQEEEEVTDD